MYRTARIKNGSKQPNKFIKKKNIFEIYLDSPLMRFKDFIESTVLALQSAKAGGFYKERINISGG